MAHIFRKLAFVFCLLIAIIIAFSVLSGSRCSGDTCGAGNVSGVGIGITAEAPSPETSTIGESEVAYTSAKSEKEISGTGTESITNSAGEGGESNPAESSETRVADSENGVSRVTEGSAATGTSDNKIVRSLPVVSGECYGAEACNPTGNPIGGGGGYSQIISQTDPRVKYIVSTKAQLLSALASAKSGEVVFVKGTAVIDMNGVAEAVIPVGVTLASDRGLGSSSGALIKKTQNITTSWNEPLFFANDGVRITGLRLEGEMKPKFDTSTPERGYLVGIRSYNTVEVDNCEIRGWSWAGVMSGRMTSSSNAYIHHNYIRDNQAMGEGYGIDVVGGSALIEANIFDYNRHSIAASGVEGESYEARYNLDLGHNYQYEHRFDVHANPEGGTYSGYSYMIHHNTFTNETVDGYDIKYRGSEPELGVWIDHNIFTWSESWTSRPVFSYAVSLAGKSKTHVNDNLIGIPPTTLKSDGDGIIQFIAV